MPDVFNRFLCSSHWRIECPLELLGLGSAPAPDKMDAGSRRVEARWIALHISLRKHVMFDSHWMVSLDAGCCQCLGRRGR